MTPTPHIPGAEIAACDHCSVSDAELAVNGGWYFVECQNCPRRTATFATASAAIAAWNRLEAAANVPPQVNEAVTVKPLEWRYYPDAFPPAWDAQTSIGRYSIAQESVEADAAGEPIDATDIWVITRDGRTIGSKYDLDAAKTLAVTDCKKRVRGVLEVPRLANLVRPLKWEAVGDGFVREEAECVIGLYRLAQSRITNTWRWSLNALDGPWSLELPTRDEAKAAAQADYEQRIMSALASPSPGTATAGASEQSGETVAFMGPDELAYLKQNPMSTATAWGSNRGKESSIALYASDQSRVERLETALKESQTSHEAARANFLTMQGTANELRIRAERYAEALRDIEQQSGPHYAANRARQALRGDRS